MVSVRVGVCGWLVVLSVRDAGEAGVSVLDVREVDWLPDCAGRCSAGVCVALDWVERDSAGVFVCVEVDCVERDSAGVWVGVVCVARDSAGV